jgi:hypothetical protein
MANVGVLLFRVRPEIFCLFATPHTRAGEEKRSARVSSNSWRDVMSRVTARRAVVTTSLSVLVITSFCVTNCATYSQHEFSEPATGWQTKNGQLMYRTPKTTVIGDALVRFSKTGDFELTVSKGPGITLLSLRQDASFAELKGAFARQGWSGPVDKTPPQLRGWLELRDQFVQAPDRKTLRYVSGDETFLFRF